MSANVSSDLNSYTHWTLAPARLDSLKAHSTQASTHLISTHLLLITHTHICCTVQQRCMSSTE